ncbi:unnamed protein product [Rotaria sp. Silwood2]|nr:unnamed protein product [Rotaria sp. Silwood2]CAF2985618.1 unnamed protein product [Rotaria sp. Silwood2]CAF3268089.1 unnamed protein product [Rotaria sp. Silwood2]CAF3370269.1 unnamed protein product [Rotaria sp. Silwood2]CAF4103021.1 unnamed protein product [Rotaria sp. Silwood2]
MKQKLSQKNTKPIEKILDHNNDQNNELIITTSQTNSLITSNSINDPNSSETNTDISTSTPTPLSQQNIGGRKFISRVWLYAKKSDDDQEAACLLCDYICSCRSHSTSTIRQHLIIKHNKTDLILKSSSVHAKSKISEALKNELHQLCYVAIIKDSRPFNDLNKIGITALINKLYPGHWMSNSIDSVSKFIDFSCFNERHTAIEIARVLRENMIDLDVYEKIICITCDGAENLVLACELLNEDIIRIWCYAHRLHLVVINALGFWVSEKKNNIDGPSYSLANVITLNTTTSNVIDHESEQETMDIEWDHEINDDSWNINDVDFIDETNTYNNNATTNTEFSEVTYFYDDELINEQDIIELINDS